MRGESPAQRSCDDTDALPGLSSDPGTFNPIIVTDAASGAAIGDLFEGLVKINPQTTLPEPDLAQSWQLVDGGKTIAFHLRHDVKWSDGVGFTARDVLFTMRLIYDPRVPNSMISSLTVDGKPLKVEAPDDYTVIMKLPRPFAPLLYAIGVPIIPEHVLAKAAMAGQFNRTWGIDTPPPIDLPRTVPDEALRPRPVARVRPQSYLLDAR